MANKKKKRRYLVVYGKSTEKSTTANFDNVESTSEKEFPTPDVSGNR